MHLPEHFELPVDAALGLIRERVLGTLVVADGAGLEATPVPFWLDSGADGAPVLHSHVSRVNPLAANRTEGPALVVFAGPDAYVSPSWYPSKSDGGRAVPTWNYVAVHVHGTVRLVDDEAWLHQQVRKLSEHLEARLEHPWSVDDAPAEYISRMIGGVVGLEMTIERIEAKAKLSQNRSTTDRDGALQGLAASGRTGAAVAQLMMDLDP